MEESSAFNIALFPEDQQLISDCTNWAQANLSSQADEYLLGNDAWPHITLCQFQIPASKAADIWKSVSSLETDPIEIHFDHLYIQAGRNEHTDKYWIGLAVRRTAQLHDLQLSIYEKLNSLGIKSGTSHKTYFPHLTWARCDGLKPPLVAVFPVKEFWLRPYLFHLSLGRSNENGVYREKLFCVQK